MAMRPVLLVLALVFAATAAHAAGDATDGRVLAKYWCSSCHVTERARLGTVVDSAATFFEIVGRPGRDADFLRSFLSDPHYPMPNFQLTRDEIDDLVAYLTSLK